MEGSGIPPTLDSSLHIFPVLFLTVPHTADAISANSRKPMLLSFWKNNLSLVVVKQYFIGNWYTLCVSNSLAAYITDNFTIRTG